MNTLDIIYLAFISMVIAGGITAILILCPKEGKLRQEKSNCYRFAVKNDRLMLSLAKPSLYEKWTDKPVYIDKGPFEVESFFEKVEGKDKKSYRSDVIIQLYLPENGAETAANYFYTILSEFSQEKINEALSAELDKVVAEAMKGYEETTDMRVFAEQLRVALSAQMGKFGYELYCPPSVKIAENKNGD